MPACIYAAAGTSFGTGSGASFAGKSIDYLLACVRVLSERERERAVEVDKCRLLFLVVFLLCNSLLQI